MVNINVNQQDDIIEQDDIIDNAAFDIEDNNQLIFQRIDEFMDYLYDDRIYERLRYIAAVNFCQYLDETCNVWKQDQELVDDIVWISNKYLNSIWLNARVIARQEGVGYPDERHIRDRLSRELMESIHYFMDTHINQ
jgi:hypothetical protein